MRECARVPRPLSCAPDRSRAQGREVIVRPLNRDSDIYGIRALNSCRARQFNPFGRQRLEGLGRDAFDRRSLRRLAIWLRVLIADWLMRTIARGETLPRLRVEGGG